MTAHAYMLVIPAPGEWLRTNQRDHFHQTAKLTKLWRETAAWEARRQHLPKFGMGPVHVTATIHDETKRRYDLDGVSVTVKACIDGIRDAGCLDEDDWRVIPELTLRHGEQWADAAVVITFTEIGDAA